MKNRYKLLLFLIVLICPWGCRNNEIDTSTYCDPKFESLISYMNLPRPVDSYNYPVLPCMNKWKEFTSTEQMKQATSIPVDELRKMSTQAVIQALWEYPFFVNPLAMFDGARDIQKDFESTMRINTYQELLLRQDAAKCLYQRYVLLDPVCEGHLFHPFAFKLLMCQSVFLSQLKPDEKKELVTLAFKNDSIFTQKGHDFGAYGSQVLLMFIGRVMFNAKYIPFVNEVSKDSILDKFINTAVLYVQTQDEYDQKIKSVTDYAKQFILTKSE